MGCKSDGCSCKRYYGTYSSNDRNHIARLFDPTLRFVGSSHLSRLIEQCSIPCSALSFEKYNKDVSIRHKYFIDVFRFHLYFVAVLFLISEKNARTSNEHREQTISSAIQWATFLALPLIGTSLLNSVWRSLNRNVCPDAAERCSRPVQPVRLKWLPVRYVAVLNGTNC